MSNSLSKQLRQHNPLPKLMTLVVLGLAVHLMLPQIASLEHSWQTLRSMAVWAVSLAVLMEAFSYISMGFLLKNLIKITGQSVSLLRSTMIYIGGSSVGMVAGGMVGSSAAIFRWINQDDANSDGAVLAGLAPGLLNNIILILVSMIGLVHLILVHDLTSTQLVSFVLMLLILSLILGALVYAVRYRERSTFAVNWLAEHYFTLRRKAYDPNSVNKSMNNLFTAWDTLQKGGWKPVILGAALNVFFDFLCLYFLFIASGHTVSPGLAISGYGLPLLLGKMAFIIPGGVGVVESGMTALYNGLGVPDAVTVVVVLGYRLISFWIPSLLGFPVAVILENLSTKQRKQSKAMLPEAKK